MLIQKNVNRAFMLTIILLLVCVSGCEKMPPLQDIPNMEAEDTEESIAIGVIVSLTGKDAEPYGLPMLRGFELARDEINSAVNQETLPLRFLVEDDKSTEDGAIAAVQKLVDMDVPVIIGIAISDYLEDAFPIAQAAGVVAFSPTSSAAGLSSIGDYVFRAALATNIFIPNGVAVTQEALGYTKAALIYDADDTYSVSSNTELKKALMANGVEIVTEQTFRTHDTDFQSQLTAIKDASVDAIFISALAPEKTLILAQGRLDVGIPTSVHYIVPELSNAVVQEVGGDLNLAVSPAEGAIAFAGWDAAAKTPGNSTFVHNYRTHYNREPEPWAAQSYAALYILAEAIANAQTTDADAIRDALAQTQGFPTILGDFSFDPNGEALYDPIILIVKDGILEVFEQPILPTVEQPQ